MSVRRTTSTQAAEGPSEIFKTALAILEATGASKAEPIGSIDPDEIRNESRRRELLNRLGL